MSEEKKKGRRSRRGYDPDAKAKDKRRKMDRTRDRQTKRQNLDLFEAEEDYTQGAR